MENSGRKYAGHDSMNYILINHTTVTKNNGHQIQEIVKTMDRGQITLPAEIRKALGIKPQTLLWTILGPNEEIIIKKVEKPKRTKTDMKKVRQLLEEMRNDPYVYWTKEDDRNREKVRKLDKEKLKKLYA